MWVPARGFEAFYEANTDGRIRNRKTGRVLLPSTRKDGYQMLTLCDEDGRHAVYVHRVIASTFIPNESKKPQVNHIDENKSNNAAYNLEWVTSRENNVHGTVNRRRVETATIEALRLSAARAREFLKKPVINLDTGKTYQTITAAAEDVGGRRYNLVSTLKGRHKTFMGCRWSYIKEAP